MRPLRGGGVRLLFLLTALVASAAASCLLTSDFDNIAGARPPGEAGVEEGTDEDAGTEGGPVDCTGGSHVVCTDFDQSTSLPVPGWNHASTGGGTIALDEKVSVSSPRSLRAKITGTSPSQAYVYRNAFLGSFTRLNVQLDIQIVACPGQGTSAVTLVFIQPSEAASFGLVVLSSGVHALGSQIDGGSTFFNLEQQLPTGTWAHVVYDILIKDPSTAHFTLSVDGKKVVDSDAPSAAIRQTALLNLGTLGTAPKGCEVLFDNYVLDKE